MWWDDSHTNFNQTGFGLFTYVGGNNQQSHGNTAEAIAIMPAILGYFISPFLCFINTLIRGGLVGIDQANKSGPGYSNVNFAHMLQNYFSVLTKQYEVIK